MQISKELRAARDAYTAYLAARESAHTAEVEAGHGSEVLVEPAEKAADEAHVVYIAADAALAAADAAIKAGK